MRQLFLLTLLFPSFRAAADCAPTGMYFWPKRSLAAEKATVVITGYALTQAIILELGRTHEVALVCGKEKIPMRVSKVHVGQFELTQAILVAETRLTPGQLYTLSISGLPENEDLLRVRESNGLPPRMVQWIAEPATASSAPQWIGKPKYLSRTYRSFGCGPAQYVSFELPVQGSSEYLVRAIVTDISTATSTTYCVAPDTNGVQLGHGMCAGEFAFTPGVTYSVRFDLMDRSGELVQGPEVVLTFQGPGPADTPQ